MQKEKLTLSHIRQDLHTQEKESCAELIEFSALCLVSVGLFILAFGRVPELFIPTLLLMLFGGSVGLYYTVIYIRKLVWLHRAKNNPACIAHDRLVNSEMVVAPFHHVGEKGVHRLHFAHYGDYAIPGKNYTWSAAFSMGPMGVFNGSVDGDEFYLVLSKPHSGKILYAYNAKLFELEE